jgi:hypothetical protein
MGVEGCQYMALGEACDWADKRKHCEVRRPSLLRLCRPTKSLERMRAGQLGCKFERAEPPASLSSCVRCMRAPVAGIIGAVVTSLLMVILRRTVLPSARRRGLRHVLEYGWPIRSLGIAMPVLGGVFLYAASRSSSDQRSLAWVVAGALATCSLYVFLELFFVRVEFDESFVYMFSPWRGGRRIPRSDIVSCSFSNLNQWYVIRTRADGKLRISTFMSGSGSFLEKLHDAGHI